MERTAVVIDPRYQNHDAKPNHPERPERIRALIEMLSRYGREGLVEVAPRMAAAPELLANHGREHVAGVEATSGREYHAFDYDTVTGAETYDTARLAAGGLLAVLDAIMRGDADNGFAMVRPPGHHAEADRAMGFCFFNNVAIGARYLRDVYGLERILIADWDVHHGNGTQRSFYANDDVLFLSTHQYPHYPGTGAATDVGVAGGMGYTVNVPLPAGFGNAEYEEAFARIVEPIGRQFEPDFVLISAGFDCHDLDPLGGMHVTYDGFARMTRGLLSVARERSKGHCAAVLEGGYNLDGLKEGVTAVLDEMALERDPGLPAAESRATSLLNEISKIQSRFWKL
jgi:acetoin utilization deacetylase AcuC-like enzyme